MKLKSRYNVGDIVWTIHDNRPVKCRIKSVFFYVGEDEKAPEGVKTKVAYSLVDISSEKDLFREFVEGDRNNQFFASPESLFESL